MCRKWISVKHMKNKSQVMSCMLEKKSSLSKHLCLLEQIYQEPKKTIPFLDFINFFSVFEEPESSISWTPYHRYFNCAPG
ncbi:MAG: hypothetical protein D5R98_01830 [Desulfonatronovibrio sp. MSAO_Bac4]|nr:MAG: hypothetical protein D5R98_01830 [Desulfonatronovibrio sp. MSAO_Bac4]